LVQAFGSGNRFRGWDISSGIVKSNDDRNACGNSIDSETVGQKFNDAAWNASRNLQGHFCYHRSFFSKNCAELRSLED
jgi:hypothetical protein